MPEMTPWIDDVSHALLEVLDRWKTAIILA